MQFISRYFLTEGNPEGLPLRIPSALFMITDITDLFLMATNPQPNQQELKWWAEIILKVMHTILHTDKDLRSNYFNVIQTQIFDRFYRHIVRHEDQSLYLGNAKSFDEIKLIDFETKSKKTRESTIIKLLHKVENVAEELFDRVGIRFVTESRFDTLRVIRFLLEENVITPHNNKPSRSLNTMIDIQAFKEAHQKIVKMAIRNKLSEERFLQAMEREILNCTIASKNSERNQFTSKSYQSLQFTCRQLIEYKNPFLHDFNDLRKMAKAQPDSELTKKILSLDLSLVARDIRFFYPYEVQIVDQLAFKENSEGEASHLEYKKQQVKSAMQRLFKPLIEFHQI